MQLDAQKDIRLPAVAGQFYPAEPQELQAMLADFFAQVEVKQDSCPRIIIVPHAGYVFSGKVAAHAFQAVEGFGIKRAVVLGVSHYFPFAGIALSSSQQWLTPLGKIEVDQSLNQFLLAGSSEAFIDDDIHRPEHCLEVQLPFLQYVLPDFTVLPLLLGGEHRSTIDFLANKLVELLQKQDILLVVSSDLSHYPDYDTATEVDQRLLAAVIKGRAEEFISVYQGLEEEFPQVDTFACGKVAILTALQIAEAMKLQGMLLYYANSCDSPWGDKERVVGYGAAAFY